MASWRFDGLLNTIVGTAIPVNESVVDNVPLDSDRDADTLLEVNAAAGLEATKEVLTRVATAVRRVRSFLVMPWKIPSARTALVLKVRETVGIPICVGHEWILGAAAMTSWMT
jgi:hypothetical protein